MSKVRRKKKKISTPPSPYLFNGILDGILYQVAFLAFPLYSVLDAIAKTDGTLFFTAMSCCFCSVYDCYSRHDKNCGKVKTAKIYILGGIHLFLMFYTFWGIVYYLNEGRMICPYVYGLLASAPIAGLADLFQMCWNDALSRR